MADYYRKFLEPEYGEAAPDAIIDVGSDVGAPFDFEHPTESRIRQNFETIARLTQEWKYTFCFPRLMRIKIENLFIDSDGYQLPVRIYKPEGEGPYKTMVFFHGGGWTMNNVDVYDSVHRYFASYGNVLVIAPDYRLAPENKFPKGFNDCYNTVVWASQHCAAYGGDPARLCVCGDSAGGNLAATVSLRARDEHGPAIAKQFLRQRYLNIKLFNVTLGPEGSVSYYKDLRVQRPSVGRGKVIETTGAGDTYCGCVLAYVLNHGLDNLTEAQLAEMITFASAAARLVTTRRGAIRSMPTRAEVEEQLQ